MDWLEKMNSAVNYIEDNLAHDIDYTIAAKKACCSVYHFQRMFSFIIEIPLSEYIRRRRLTLAAFEIQNSEIKVIDLAMKYGYESPDAFTRAFQKLHGVTPTKARIMGTELKAYPRISFQTVNQSTKLRTILNYKLIIRGGVEMNYKIVEKEAYTIFGKSFTIGIDQDPYKVIPKFWEDFQEDGTYAKICRTAGFEPYSGISLNSALYDFANDGSYRNKYMIHTVLPEEVNTPDELESLLVPAAKWVIFQKSMNRWKKVPMWYKTYGKESFLNGFRPQNMKRQTLLNLKYILVKRTQ